MFDKILFIVMYCMELHNDVTKKDMLSKVRYRLQKKVFSRKDDTYACCRWIYFTFSKSNNVIKQLLIDEDVPFVVIGKPLDEKDQFIIHIDNDNEKQVMIYVVIYIIKAIVTLFSSMNQVNML